MNITQKTIVSLIKSALYKTETSIPKDFDCKEFQTIVTRHNISGLMYFGMKNSNIEIPLWLYRAFHSRIISLENLWFLGNEISSAFDEAGIEYILLKGIVLKDLYPSPYMSQMSDVDILIHEEDYREKRL